MLKGIKDNTEAANADKKAQGITPLHVLGWVKQPAYDSATKTVRWAINAKDEGQSEPIVNSVALVLGRHGYEEFTWVVDQSKYVSSGGMLDRVVAAQHFDQGARYQDYISGDKLAGYGIAALVGTAAGATLVKTGALVGLLLLLKKFWLLLAAGVAWAWRSLTGKRKSVPPTSPLA
jgi:uncharacterized membrane-anchored protein